MDSEFTQNITRRLDKPLVLTGLSGAGKTRLGRRLAGALGLDFVDSDEEIEKAARCSVSEIFEKFGEPYFRDGERRVILRLLDGGVRVISTGGGALMTKETAGAVWRDAISIWVRAELPVILERTARTNHRPLLRGDNAEAILKKMMHERYPVYEQADIVVESHNGPAQAILNQTLQKLDDYLRRPRDDKGAA